MLTFTSVDLKVIELLSPRSAQKLRNNVDDWQEADTTLQKHFQEGTGTATDRMTLEERRHYCKTVAIN